MSTVDESEIDTFPFPPGGLTEFDRYMSRMAREYPPDHEADQRRREKRQQQTQREPIWA